MRKKIAAGNWKMNLDLTQAQTLISELTQMINDEYSGSAEVVLAPPFPFLYPAHHLLKNHSRFHLAAQNIYTKESGAYTGECSAQMIQSVGASHCIIGHSERRQYFGESHDQLLAKIRLCLRFGIYPIYCVGETLSARESGKTFEVIQQQTEQVLFLLTEDEVRKIIVAYEPVWAIGTGKTATPQQAQEVHAFIRRIISEKYGASVADETSILYGGSVTASSAPELFSQPDIDGGLVGGASLKSREFAEIVKALP
ncbi:MAG: triose-phosphate isomerase [Bacteroidia bacterium]|nr:triose-phosphate isomerase [Bacteroidia bacterium]